MLSFILLAWVSSSRLFAMENLDIYGNAEMQTRSTTNASSARELPFLGQDWKRSQFSALAANLGGTARWGASQIDFNWFARRSFSPLYRRDYLATHIMNFPNTLVARNLFRLSQHDQDDTGVTDSVLNKFQYELSLEHSRLSFGRMFINYGLGEVFNPMNPFNQPLGLAGFTNLAQGSDGIKTSYFLNERTTLNFYLLGNKDQPGSENHITRTLWFQGEFRPGNNLQLDFVGGEDQKRDKLGGQISWTPAEAMYFAQTLFSTNRLDGEASESLWDLLVGYDRQFTPTWHLRVEGGYQDSDKRLVVQNPLALQGRFLPFESFLAIAPQWEAHPLLKLSATVVHDFKTRFGYGLARASYSLAKDIEWDIFGLSPIYRNGAKASLIQRIVTTDLGTAVRAFF